MCEERMLFPGGNGEEEVGVARRLWGMRSSCSMGSSAVQRNVCWHLLEWPQSLKGSFQAGHFWGVMSPDPSAQPAVRHSSFAPSLAAIATSEEAWDREMARPDWLSYFLGREYQAGLFISLNLGFLNYKIGFLNLFCRIIGERNDSLRKKLY